MHHYQRMVNQMMGDKDAEFEPCVILNYDSSTMLARVYTLHSKQYRDYVPVLFPSMYLGSGVIAPPAKDSTGILFWGAENQPYLIPAYFLPPTLDVENGKIKQTSSPARVDESLDLSHVEGGEVFLRSLGGAFVHVRNLDEVEVGTSKLHRFTLSGIDGSAELITERMTSHVGGLQTYSGPVSDGSTDFHYKVQINDVVPDFLSELDDDELIAQILSDTFNAATVTDTTPIFEMQLGNVYDENQVKMQGADGADLFSQGILYSKDHLAQLWTWELSKQGTMQFKIEDDQYVSTFTFRASGLSVVSQNKSDPDPGTNTRTNLLGFA